jgi:hypothetical protein
MSAGDPEHVEALSNNERVEPESVLMRANPFTSIGRAMAGAPALSLAALIVATATMLTMSVANDLADAKLYSSRGIDSLTALRWAAGTRLIIAGVALLLAVIAGIRYSRDLPATRFTFTADGEEASESIEGVEAPGWARLLVGAAVVVALIAVALNGTAWALTLHLHESPNFGLPDS